MSCLENSRHERFAQFIAQGVKKQDAYEQAGFKVGSNNANKLMKNFPEIGKRIKQLQNKRQRTMQSSDVETIIDKTEASRILSKMARDEQNGTEQGRRLSLVVLARMYGWNTPEVIEVNNTSEMSDAELERLIKDNKKGNNMGDDIGDMIGAVIDDGDTAEGFLEKLSENVRNMGKEFEKNEQEELVKENNNDSSEDSLECNDSDSEVKNDVDEAELFE